MHIWNWDDRDMHAKLRSIPGNMIARTDMQYWWYDWLSKYKGNSPSFHTCTPQTLFSKKLMFINNTHTHTHTHIYIYIYIYREREREKDWQRDRERGKGREREKEKVRQVNRNLWTGKKKNIRLCVYRCKWCKFDEIYLESIS